MSILGISYWKSGFYELDKKRKITEKRFSQSYEFQIYCDNGGSVFCDDKTLPIRLGAITVAPPGACLNTLGPMNCYYLWFKVNGNETTFEKEYLKKLPLYLIPGDSSSFFRIFCEIAKVDHMKTDPVKELYLVSKSLELVQMILDAASENKQKNYSPLIRDAIAYIENNLSEEITVNQIASNFNYSTSRFNTVFHEETGISPWEYVKSKRLELAKKLLIEGNLISRVVELTGFKSDSYFSNAFKKATGMSPSDFKKKNNSNYPDS